MIRNESHTSEKRELTAKQKRAALCLAQGMYVDRCAAEIGVAPVTIYRWKRREEFRDAIRQAEDELYSEQLRMLKKAAGAAIGCLISNMGGKISPYVQVSAASKVLDLGLQVHKVTQLEQEIERLQLLLGQGDDASWQP